MAGSVKGIDSRLIAFVLPAIPESVRAARFGVRAALAFHRLDQYADDAAAITSELVTNVVQHVCGDGTGTVEVILVRTRNPEAVTVIVSDSSPDGPAVREASAGSERAGACESWRRCLLTGAGIRKRAAKRSSRYSRRSRKREARAALPRR
jgi:anti-sigma regulatory factor (Ser/Thr protein kinase)